MRLSVHPVQDNSKGNTDFTNWAGASGNVGVFLSRTPQLHTPVIVQVVERWSRNLVVGGGGGGGPGVQVLSQATAVFLVILHVHTVSSSYSIHVSMKYVYMHFLLKIQSRYISLIYSILMCIFPLTDSELDYVQQSLHSTQVIVRWSVIFDTWMVYTPPPPPPPLLIIAASTCFNER